MSNDESRTERSAEVERYNAMSSWLQARFFIIDRHLNKHDSRFDQVFHLIKHLTKHDNSSKGVCHLIELLKRQNSRRFKTVNDRLDDLNDRVTSLGGRVVNVELDLTAIGNRLDGIEARITELPLKPSQNAYNSEALRIELKHLVTKMEEIERLLEECISREALVSVFCYMEESARDLFGKYELLLNSAKHLRKELLPIESELRRRYALECIGRLAELNSDGLVTDDEYKKLKLKFVGELLSDL